MDGLHQASAQQWHLATRLVRRAFVEALRVGDPLPTMPLFLETGSYVEVPLEATYQTAFDDVPKPYRDELSALNEKQS